MNTIFIIGFASVLVWMFPPIKNFRTKYFGFFVTLAAADVLALLCYWTGIMIPNKVHLIASFFLVVTLLDQNFIKKFLPHLTAILILIIAIALLSSPSFVFIVMVPIYFFAVILILKDFVEHILGGKLNVFRVVLAFYMTTLFLKLIFLLTDVKLGIPDFYITSFFDLFPGIYFTFANVKTGPEFRMLFGKTS